MAGNRPVVTCLPAKMADRKPRRPAGPAKMADRSLADGGWTDEPRKRNRSRDSRRVAGRSPEDAFHALAQALPGPDRGGAARQAGSGRRARRGDSPGRQGLGRRTKNNPAPIGEPGVGKTAVAEGLAQRIAAGDGPGSLRGKTLAALDVAAMLAGAKRRGDFEKRFPRVRGAAVGRTASRSCEGSRSAARRATACASLTIR